MILSLAASQLKVDVSHEQIIQFVALIGTIYGALHTYWGRYRIGDITWYGAKK